MNTQQKAETTELVEDLLWRFGEAEFDERAGVLKLAGIEIELEPRPLEVLAYLLRHAGEVVTKDELLEAVWHRKPELISDKVLTNAIGKLRRELKDEQEAIITTLPRRGYRLSAPVSRVVVGRRAVPKLDFKPGEKVPRREQWRLIAALDVSQRSEVWLAEHEKTHARRVFKFSADGARLSALKREVTLSRVLVESLGERADFIPVLEWNFEEAPYFIECDYGGDNWLQWAEAQGGLGSVPLATRLDLFAQAAEAIGAAHGVGVLHKDIKPANLLISPKPDGGWQVRVTDFGSGRLMEPGRLEELGITRLGFTQTQAVSSDSLTGTPLYLAPELLAGQSPTQASDVYALGVLLYQLLVADFKKPLSAGWEREVDEELLREDIALAAAGDAGLRLDSARALAQRVAQLPQRRLERSAALRQAGEIETARLSLARARQRRPWIFAAGLALAAGILVSGAALHTAQRERENALTQLASAEAVNRFLQSSLIAKASPYKAGRQDLTVREAIDAAAGEVDKNFGKQPRIAAATHRSIALAYKALTLRDKAILHFKKSIELLSSLVSASDKDLLKTRIELADTYGNASQFDQMQQQLSEVKSSAPSSAKDIQIQILAMEASLMARQLKFAEAIEPYQKALTLAGGGTNIEPELLDAYSHNLAICLVRSGRISEGEAIQREMLSKYEQKLGSKHAETIEIRKALASTLGIAQRNAEAQEIIQTALADAEIALGPNHDVTLDLMTELAISFNQAGDPNAAIAIGEEKLLRLRAKQPEGTPNRVLMVTLLDLGNQLVVVKRNKEAIVRLNQALDMVKQLHGDTHAFHHAGAMTLAIAYLNEGQPGKASALLDRFDPETVARATQWKDQHARLALCRGREREMVGDYGASKRYFQQAVDQYASFAPETDSDFIQAKQGLNRLVKREGAENKPSS